MADKKVTFDILARDKASRAFRSVGDEAKRTGHVMGTLNKGAIAIGTAAGNLLVDGFYAAGRSIKSFYSEARESVKIGALTAQVIKTTGGAAGVSAEQVGDLAEAISEKTGIDDEAIQSGANLLLTFKNVRNELGQGNQIFDAANGLINDMSVALGQDLKSSAIQVGKALNDPIRGVTALQRVGVTFTEAQKEQIKTLVETGRTMEAQKVILRELSSEFGGAAEAAATPWDKVRVKLGNVREELGKKLLPAMDALGTWITDKGIPAASRFSAWFQAHVLPTLRNIAAFVRDTLIPNLKTLAAQVMPAVQDAARNLTASVNNLRAAFGLSAGSSSRMAGSLQLIPTIARLVSAELRIVTMNVRILTGGFRILTANIRFLVSQAERAISVLSRLKDLAPSMPKLNLGGGFGKLSVPGLATGGVVKARPGGTLVRVGEGGHDEAVVPLSGPNRPRGGGGGGVHIETVNVYGTDAKSAVAHIPRALSNAQFALGRA